MNDISTVPEAVAVGTVVDVPAAGARSAWPRRCALLAACLLGSILLPALGLVHEIYFDRSRLPDLDPFLRFEPPTIGAIRDVRGEVLIELARERRRLVSFDELPPILWQAVLAAEDKNFFSHRGVDYTALPRVVRKAVVSSLTLWWSGGAGFRLRLPQGGSTITQQLVRGFFLTHLTRRENGSVLSDDGAAARLLAAMVGVPAANRLLRKKEEIRLSLWIEEEMRRHYGSREAAKREIFVRYANFLYLGHGRYGFATASEYYFAKPLSSYGLDDVGKAALLAGIAKAPQSYAPVAGDPRPLRRRNQILALMARAGFISEGLAEHAQSEPLVVATRPPVEPARAPAAVGHVVEELKGLGGTRFGVEDLFRGRISVVSTVDARVQTIVTEELENGLARYESRHPSAKGSIQGSVVLLRNSDAAILAETGGRELQGDRPTRYSDFNRATDSIRQPGSAWKPLVYLAAFRRGFDLSSLVPDDPFGIAMGEGRPLKWIRNYDDQFKGPIPMRQALAESRNAAAVWIGCEIGFGEVTRTARELGIRTPVQPHATTALGASGVRLIELAGAYRAMASGIAADPHVVARVTHTRDGLLLYEAPGPTGEIRFEGLHLIQEGLRGVVRLPGGTAHRLDSRDFPIDVMGKTGTTNAYRDALFVGSTYGPEGITVAVRIGFDDNRSLGNKETGARAALPIFREIMLRVYEAGLVGPAPKFPREIERAIDTYLAKLWALERRSEDAAPLPTADDPAAPPPPRVSKAILECSA